MSNKSREIRLGLVLYGGVSLAIYINGVTREFHRAVRGEGIYRVIKALTDSDITVDIVSGTSAGGINGVLLAHTLANQGGFAATAKLWRDHGDIANLILDPRKCADANSLLDGEGYFQPALRDALHQLGATAPLPAGPYDDPSPVPELDLFVTGTDAHGDVYTWFDDQGHAVDVKDHRTVFRLKHRALMSAGNLRVRYTDFAPEPSTDLALAKLGRITACFPSAFPPVPVSKVPPKDLVEAQADARLRTWGQLAEDRDYFFLDGGVLDNKPFSYTTRQIFFRLADRPVRRWLFYVEPDPESFTPPSKRSLTAPSVTGAALSALLSIPGYESIGGDLRAIAERNADLERFNLLWEGAALALAGMPRSEAVTELTARESRDAGEFQCPAGPSSTPMSLYVQARLLGLARRAIQGVLRLSGRDRLIETAQDRSATARLVRGFMGHREADPLDTLHDFDIYFRLRRLFHLLYLDAWREAVGSSPRVDGDDVPNPVQEMRRALSGSVDLLQVVLTAMERTVDRAELRTAPNGDNRDAEEVWNLLEAALFCLLYPVLDAPMAGPRQPPEIAASLPLVPDPLFLSALSETLGARTAALVKCTGEAPVGESAEALRAWVFQTVFGPPPPAEDRPLTLLRVLDVSLRRLLSQAIPGQGTLSEALREAYEGFLATDELMFPLQKDPLVFERDVLRVVRVSPKDAGRGLSALPDYHDKVSGDVLGHFGAFFKRSWRSNDILWGRLDGLCQLTETLLEPERVCEILSARGTTSTLAALVGVTDLEQLFPNAGAERLLHLESAFAAMAHAAPAGGDAFETVWPGFLEALIETGHSEILADDLATVIRDAAEQAVRWNNFPVDVKDGTSRPGVSIQPERLVFRQGDRPLDPTLAALLFETACAADRLAPGSGSPLDRVAFFREHYRVGRESVAGHIPPEVLANTATKALNVAYRAMLNALPPDLRPRFARLRPVKTVGRALAVGHGLSTLYAEGRAGRRTLLTTASTLALAAVAITVGVAAGVVRPGETSQGLFWGALAAPVVVLVLWSQVKSGGLAAAIRTAAVIAVLALAIWGAVQLAPW